jgi:tetratricopeptide (TPR) repeat protein
MSARDKACMHASLDLGVEQDSNNAARGRLNPCRAAIPQDQPMNATLPRAAETLIRAITIAAILQSPLLLAQDKGPPLPAGLIRGPSQEVLALGVKGRGLRNQGDYDGATAAFHEALGVAREAKDRPGEAWALNNIASVYRYQATEKKSKDLAQQAVDFYEQARTIARLSGDKHNDGYATLYLGVLAADRGDGKIAMKFYEEALPLFTAVDDRYYMARTNMFMGRATLHQFNQPHEALAFFERALPDFRQVQMWNEAEGVLTDMKVAYERLSGRGNAKK